MSMTTTTTTKQNFAIVSKLIEGYNKCYQSNVPSLLDMCLCLTSIQCNINTLTQLNQDVKDRRNKEIFFKTIPSIVTKIKEDSKCRKCFKGYYTTFKKEYNIVFFTPTGAFYIGENGHFSHFETIHSVCSRCQQYPNKLKQK